MTPSRSLPERLSLSHQPRKSVPPVQGFLQGCPTIPGHPTRSPFHTQGTLSAPVTKLPPSLGQVCVWEGEVCEVRSRGCLDSKFGSIHPPYPKKHPGMGGGNESQTTRSSGLRLGGDNFYSTGQQALYTVLILPQACLPLALGGEGVHWVNPDSLGASLCSSMLWDHPRTEQACLCPFGVWKGLIPHPMCWGWRVGHGSSPKLGSCRTHGRGARHIQVRPPGSGSLELAFNGLGAQGSFLLGNWLLGRWGLARAPTRLGRGGAKSRLRGSPRWGHSFFFFHRRATYPPF